MPFMTTTSHRSEKADASPWFLKREKAPQINAGNRWTRNSLKSAWQKKRNLEWFAYYFEAARRQKKLGREPRLISLLIRVRAQWVTGRPNYSLNELQKLVAPATRSNVICKAFLDCTRVCSRTGGIDLYLPSSLITGFFPLKEYQQEFLNGGIIK